MQLDTKKPDKFSPLHELVEDRTLSHKARQAVFLHHSKIDPLMRFRVNICQTPTRARCPLSQHR
jgi:hypothetical protein